jgi:DNA processing protein
MDIESNRDEIEAWLILLRAPGLGASRLRELIDRHCGALRALEAARRGDVPVDAAACRDALCAPDRARIASDLDWLAADAHLLLTADSPDFPPLLRDVPGGPVALFVVGDASALWQAQIAIVGSRSASHGGLAHARTFARALSAAGLSITSGLAEGIDAAAHTTALDVGAITIAVLGTGPDLVFPLRHRELAARIAEQGALVSEFPPGTPGRPENFPRRNRIIAGLALGTLVVEAGLRSGSLITARCAGDQGREVFAIPGSIQNPLARGCHRLIRQGATLVETADEIIEALGPLAAHLGAALRDRLATAGCAAESAPQTSRDPETIALLSALGHEAQSIDALAERTGIDVAALSSMLLVLELEREVAAERGGLYVRCRSDSG